MSVLRKTCSIGLAGTITFLAPGIQPYAAFAQAIQQGSVQGPVAPIAGVPMILSHPTAPMATITIGGAGLPGGTQNVAPQTIAANITLPPSAAVGGLASHAAKAQGGVTPIAAASTKAGKSGIAAPNAGSQGGGSGGGSDDGGNGEGRGGKDQGRVLFDGSGLQKSPVDVQLPGEVTEKLSPSQREDAAGYIAVLKARLFTWKSFPVQLPGTVFDEKSGRIVDVKDLFQAPTSDEVRRIGTSDGGRGPKLTPEQRAQIKETATFSVPSVDYPGLSHVWQLGLLLQKGQQAIRETFRGHKAAAAEQVVLNIPDRLWNDADWSLRRGAANFAVAIKGIVGLTVGVTEERSEFYEGEIAAKVEEARVQRVKAWAAHESPMPIDLGLYEPKLMEAAAPLVKAVESKAAAAWKQGVDAVRAEVEDELRKAGTPADQFAQAVADRMSERYNAAFFSALAKDAALEAVGPGLGALLANHGKAGVAVAQAKAVFESGMRDFRAAAYERLSQEHPVLSKISRWTQGKLDQATEAHRVATEAGFEDSLPGLLAKQGLAQEAAILGHDVGFYRTEGQALRAKMAAARVASHSFTHRRFIWRPSQWKITKVEATENQPAYYTLQRYTVHRVSTQTPAWRLANMAVRFYTWTSNVMYGLTQVNLVNGPVGLKSLFYAEPFHYEWTVDRETGKLVRTGATFGTLRSRVRGFYAQRGEALKDFYSKGDYGLLGRDFRRALLFFPLDLGLGVLAPLLTIVGQPVLTLANTIVSLGLTATAWAWGPAVSAAWWAFNALIVDVEGTEYKRRKYIGWIGRVLPSAQHVVFGMGLGGIGVAVVGVLGAIAHAGVAAGHGLWGVIRTVARQAWDFVGRGIVALRGRVPARDEKYLVRRVAGPGLTSEHFFQVSPELLLVAHQAGLEADAVGLYGENAANLVRMPRRVYEETLGAFEAVTGKSGGYQDKAPAFEMIGAKEKASLEQLSEALKERQALYGRLLSVPSQSRIKLPATAFEATLKKAVLLTKNFYTRFFEEQGFDADAVKAFWKAKDVAPGDWEGLAKGVLAKTFGSEILVALEPSDKSLKIEVQASTLHDYAAGLEAGMLPEDLAQIELSGIARGKTDQEPQSRVPKADADKVLASGLL